MKKLLIIFLIFILFGCVNNNQDLPVQIDKQDEYITEINELSFYDVLNDDAKNIIDNANIDEEEIENYLLEMWGKDLVDYTVSDLYGNDFNFKDLKDKKVMIEIAQYNCAHCKAQMEHLQTLAIANPDIVFVQYFMAGDLEKIYEFYEKSGKDFIDNIIVIPENKELRELFEKKYNPQYTPTFMFFNNDCLTYAKIGDFSFDIFNAVYDIAYNNALPYEELTDKDGNSIFSIKREYDDVLNDYSIENINKLNLFNNAQDLTVNIVGKKIDYYDLYDKEGTVEYYKEDYTNYVNKELVVYYVAELNGNLKNDLDLIKEFKNNHLDLNVLCILMDNKDLSTSSAYKQLNYEANFDVVSLKSVIPAVLVDIEVGSYPAAIYIENNIITGGFNEVKKVDELEGAYLIFIGDNCISLIKNN